MRILFFSLIGFLLCPVLSYSQEIGRVINDGHSITLLKSNDQYACVYTDVNMSSLYPKKAFVFPNKETLYKIIIDGFINETNHQVYVQTGKKSIVKFEYKIIKGVMFVKINHNNLHNNIIGNTTFLTKDQIDELFGKKPEVKV